MPLMELALALLASSLLLVGLVATFRTRSPRETGVNGQ
jgi:hypothetical protein